MAGSSHVEGRGSAAVIKAKITMAETQGKFIPPHGTVVMA